MADFGLRALIDRGGREGVEGRLREESLPIIICFLFKIEIWSTALVSKRYLLFMKYIKYGNIYYNYIFFLLKALEQ